MRAALPLLACLALAGPGCPDDIRVCEIDPADNLCSSDADCVLGYCATDCCHCPNAYSTRQIDGGWCLEPMGETPLTECLRGREDRCAGHPPCVCVYSVEPWCNAGRCDLRSRP